MFASLFKQVPRSRFAWTLLMTACSHPPIELPAGGAGIGRNDADSGGNGRNEGRNPDDSDYIPGEACARVEVMGLRVVPTVWLMVDGSGSMGTPMQGGPSRWNVLRDALLADGSGLVARLQASVAFGLFVYDGGLSPPGIKTDLCPRVIRIEPALNNLNDLSTAYPIFQMGASTPTHYALIALRDHVTGAGGSSSGSPTYVVLATDGRPNICDFHDGVLETLATEQQAVMTVSDLAQAGIKTFAVSMAEDDPTLVEHLDAIAKAGATGQPTFTPKTGDALVEALNAILERAVTCDVKLQGTVVAGSECRGDVQVNGKSLECGGANGFRVKDDLETLELLGSACETYKKDQEATLKATFPCDEIILF